MYKKKTRAKKFKYNVNKKKQWKKSKKLPAIGMKELKETWNKHMTVKQNFRTFGLCFDPNSITSKDKSINKDNTEVMEIVESKKTMAKHLEKLAEENAPVKTGIINNLSVDNIEFCKYMISKYSEDYKVTTKIDHHI
ncbi:unnamed protein product [Gordionus sp. m RMFG-2023]